MLLFNVQSQICRLNFILIVGSTQKYIVFAKWYDKTFITTSNKLAFSLCRPHFHVIRILQLIKSEWHIVLSKVFDHIPQCINCVLPRDTMSKRGKLGGSNSRRDASHGDGQRKGKQRNFAWVEKKKTAPVYRERKREGKKVRFTSRRSNNEAKTSSDYNVTWHGTVGEIHCARHMCLRTERDSHTQDAHHNNGVASCARYARHKYLRERNVPSKYDQHEHSDVLHAVFSASDIYAPANEFARRII